MISRLLEEALVPKFKSLSCSTLNLTNTTGQTIVLVILGVMVLLVHYL